MLSPGARRLTDERPRVGAWPAGYAIAGATVPRDRAATAEIAKSDFFMFPHFQVSTGTVYSAIHPKIKQIHKKIVAIWKRD
jgi:hypothetical protein